MRLKLILVILIIAFQPLIAKDYLLHQKSHAIYKYGYGVEIYSDGKIQQNQTFSLGYLLLAVSYQFVHSQSIDNRLQKNLHEISLHLMLDGPTLNGIIGINWGTLEYDNSQQPVFGIFTELSHTSWRQLHLIARVHYQFVTQSTNSNSGLGITNNLGMSLSFAYGGY